MRRPRGWRTVGTQADRAFRLRSGRSSAAGVLPAKPATRDASVSSACAPALCLCSSVAKTRGR